MGKLNDSKIDYERLYRIANIIRNDNGNDYDDTSGENKIRNRLIPWYNLLIGKILDSNKSSKTKNYIDDIYLPKLDIDKYDDEELAHIFEIMLRHQDNIKNNTMETNRKYIFNLLKIDVDLDMPFLDDFMSEANRDNNAEKTQTYAELYKNYTIINCGLKNIILAYLNQINNEKGERKTREVLYNKYIKKIYTIMDNFFTNRDAEYLKKEFSDSPIYEVIRQYIENIINSIENLDIWKDIVFVYLYDDIISYLIFRVTYYCIFLNENFDKETKSCYLERMLNCVNEIIPKEEPKKEILNKNTKIEIVFYFMYFIFMIEKRENINMYNLFKEECADRQPVVEKYRVKKGEHIEKMKDKAERYLEDKPMTPKTFRNHYDFIDEKLDTINNMVGRHLKKDDITYKAVFREIILDKKKYGRDKNKKTPLTMLKEHMDQFDLLSRCSTEQERHDLLKNIATEHYKFDHYLLTEKINMGMLREYGLLDEYWIKNDFQVKLYYLLCMIGKNLNPDIIFDKSKNLFSALFEESDKMFS